MENLPYTFGDILTRSISTDLYSNLSFADLANVSHVNKVQRELVTGHFMKPNAASRFDHAKDGYSSMMWSLSPRNLWSNAEILDAHVADCRHSTSVRVFVCEDLILLCPKYRPVKENHPVLVYKDNIYRGKLKRHLRGRVDGIQSFEGHIFVASSNRYRLEVFSEETLEDVTEDYRRENLSYFEHNDEARYMLEALPAGIIVQFRRIRAQDNEENDRINIATYNLWTGGVYSFLECGFGHRCSDKAYSDIMETHYWGRNMDLACPAHGGFVLFDDMGNGSPHWKTKLQLKSHQRAFVLTTNDFYGYVYRDDRLIFMLSDLSNVVKPRSDFHCNPSVPPVKTEKLIVFSVLDKKKAGLSKAMARLTEDMVEEFPVEVKPEEPKPRIVILSRNTFKESINETHIEFQQLKGVVSNLQLIKERFLIVEVTYKADKTVVTMDLAYYKPVKEKLKEQYKDQVFEKFREYPSTNFCPEYNMLKLRSFKVVGVSNEEELIMMHKGSKALKIIK